MKLAIVGSRSLHIEKLADYLPSDMLAGITEIVSGGAKGIDSAAVRFAEKNGIKLTLFLPEYTKYRRAAPLKRNEQIAEYADEAIAFWDGSSKGTAHAVKQFQIRKKPVRIILLNTKATQKQGNAP